MSIEFDIPEEDFGERSEDPEQLGQWRAELINSVCTICGKILGKHSDEEQKSCEQKHRETSG